MDNLDKMDVVPGNPDINVLPKDGDGPGNDPVPDQKDDQNPYGYLKKDYTTELFKIEISNLPKSTSHPAFMNFLRKRNVKYRKVKVMPSRSSQTSHAYVTLKSDEERLKAMKILDGIEFRGKTLSVKESNPLPDPLIMKRLEEPEADKDAGYDQLSAEDREKMINDQVCSLWKMPYEEQITVKLDRLKAMMKKCFNELKSLNNSQSEKLELSLQWFRNYNLEENLVRAPRIDGYRNKYEFNVGSDGKVGFRLGLYRQGSIRVINPPDNCPIISPEAHRIWKHFQQYLDVVSTLVGYNPVTHQGHWKQILARFNRKGQSLLSLTLARPLTLTDEMLDQECESICQHFAQPDLNVHSLYLDVIESSSAQRSSGKHRHLYGETHIMESLQISPDRRLEFRISPTSFFQINVDAAEFLYGKIYELSKCTPQTILLDICCGTGTIGLCLAHAVKRVLGFELNPEAIEDAKFNAQHNQIQNVEFHCGRAEKLLGPVLDGITAQEVEFVAILDPPRNGLPANIIKSLRNNGKIKRVIYVACEAMAARQNFIDLCRPKSKAYNKDPFVPKEAVPVDMFPHTDRCELVLVFER